MRRDPRERRESQVEPCRRCVLTRLISADAGRSLARLEGTVGMFSVSGSSQTTVSTHNTEPFSINAEVVLTLARQ